MLVKEEPGSDQVTVVWEWTERGLGASAVGSAGLEKTQVQLRPQQGSESGSPQAPCLPPPQTPLEHNPSLPDRSSSFTARFPFLVQELPWAIFSVSAAWNLQPTEPGINHAPTPDTISDDSSENWCLQQPHSKQGEKKQIRASSALQSRVVTTPISRLMLYMDVTFSVNQDAVHKDDCSLRCGNKDFPKQNLKTPNDSSKTMVQNCLKLMTENK